MPPEILNWHRYFGIALTDFFAGSPFIVELEKDLSLKKQLLDVVIIRKEEGIFNSEFTLVQPGVYDCRRGTDVVRIIVLRQLPQSEHNALLHLFSASVEQVRFGAKHYRMHSVDTSTLLERLFASYSLEGMKMSYTMADFRRDCVKEYLKDLKADEISELFQAVPPEKRLEGLSPEEKAVLRKLLASQEQNPTP